MYNRKGILVISHTVMCRPDLINRGTRPLLQGLIICILAHVASSPSIAYEGTTSTKLYYRYTHEYDVEYFLYHV